MSARLLKGSPREGLAFAPFTIPVKSGADGGGEAESYLTKDSASEEGEGQRQQISPQALAILAAAQSEAERLVTEAQARVEALEQEAYQTGLAAARANMNEEVEVAASELREQLAHTLTELESLYSLIAARAERDLVKLALEIARKVVHREVTTDSDIVLSLARVALERLHPRAVATVLLHPDDFEYVNTHRQALSNNSAVEITADKAVGRGGCIIQSEHGDIDARIEQQFASIERGFFE